MNLILCIVINYIMLYFMIRCIVDEVIELVSKYLELEIEGFLFW